MPILEQFGLVNATEAVQALLPHYLRKLNVAYVEHDEVYRELHARGRVENVKGFNVQALYETAPSPTSGFRFIGELLPGEARNIAGAERRFDARYEKTSVYLAHLYAGWRYDGLFMEAAENGDKFADVVERQMQRVFMSLRQQEDIAIEGNGTAELARVASVATDLVTVRVADTTTANAGNYGLARLRHANHTINFVDPAGGTARNIGGGTGFVIEEVDHPNDRFRADRSTVGVAAGDIIVEGDDDENSYSKLPPGMDAAIGDVDQATTYLGLTRGSPGLDFLTSRVISLASGANTGELNLATLARGMIEADFANGGRINAFSCHPLMLLEGVFGSLVEGGAPTVRSIDGMNQLRRYKEMGPLTSGAPRVTVTVGKYGSADLLPMWGHRPNVIRGINWDTWKMYQYHGGLRPLGGGSGKGGQALRVTRRHTYDEGLWRSFTLVCEFPNRNVRFENVLQLQPVTN